MAKSVNDSLNEISANTEVIGDELGELIQAIEHLDMVLAKFLKQKENGGRKSD